MLTNSLLIFTIVYIASQFLIVGLLYFAKRKLKATKPHVLSEYPGISIITSLKGPTPGACESVLSFVQQNYDGPLELIFATNDETEPLIFEIQEALKRAPHKKMKNVTVKWIYPIDTRGQNPRTIKIAKAYEAATQPWIFMTCVDTRFELDFLQRAIDRTRGDQSVFVTSFPVIDHPETFSAKLEAIGLNVDVAQFFLLSSLAEKPACAYGGAFLFSRSLGDKAGGFGPLIPLLTDDVTLAQALVTVGGECQLSDQLCRVRQQKHSMSEYWTRQIRWRMIGRYFLKDLFRLSPLSWVSLYLAVAFFVTEQMVFLHALTAVVVSRVLISFLTQSVLETRLRDRLSAWVLPIYDVVAIPAWFVASLKNTVRWGKTEMTLDSRGAVVATRDLKG